jgi:integrase
MSLYRVGEIWYIDLPTAKGRLRRSAGTADKKEAQSFHDEIKARIWRQEKLGEKPPITWGGAVEKWLSIKPRGLPDRYRLRALSISPSTSIPLPLDLMESLLSGMKAGSYNRCVSLLTAVHNSSGIAPPMIPRRPNPKGRTRWLSAEEWERLQKALKKESPLLEQCARFTLATGLRENNVLELTWDQIDLRRRVAWLHGDQMKAGVSLGVPLNDDAMAVLRERKGVHKRWVFGNPDYPLTRASNRAWYDSVRSAGLSGFRWHDLRHTWASWAVMSGVRLEELMKLGGWKTYQMVLRYSHLAPEHMAEAASKIRPISRKK